MTPYEIIGAPLTLWLAPVGTAFPLITAAPSGSWNKIGTSGDRNYSGDGVTVSHSQTIQKVRPGGAVGPVKAFRDEEDMMIKVVMWDMTLEQYANGMNGNSITTVAAGVGTAGTKKIGLSRGKSVREYALLARGLSAYDETFNAQYEVARCYQSASPEVVYRKGAPAGLSLEFTALENASAASEDERFGRLIMQHAAAL